jgi:circadian clock protein KaiC
MKKRSKSTTPKKIGKKNHKKTTHKITSKKRGMKKHSKKPVVKTKVVKTKKTKSPRKRVRTGIQNVDTLIQGGLEQNSTNTVVGGAGSGKSIFATQFLLDGLKKGEKCLYVTFEEKKKRFYNNMKVFGWDLEHYEKKGQFIFLEYTPAKVKTMLEEGGGTIETLVISKKISRMVIDSITSFALLFENELAKREAALGLFNMIRKWSCTSLLTVEEEAAVNKKSDSKPLEFESDSIILLYFVRKKGQRNRYLEIVKMRGTKHSRKIFRFAIGKKGIEVEKNPSKDFKPLN